MSDEEHPSKKSKMTIEATTSNHEVLTNTKTCAHWVKRKRRYCKMTVAKGKEYCGEHEPTAKIDLAGESSDDSNRIPCPLDGKHTIYKQNLRKHLKICNARPTADQPKYIKKNVNMDNNNKEQVQDDSKNIKLCDLEDNEFYKIIDKIKKLYKDYVEDKIKDLEYRHKSIDAELEKEEYGKESRKHLMQAASLLGILENERKIESSTSFIEFGAGKGQLAFYLAKLLESKKNSHVILVDRMSLRHKKDNKIEDRSLVQRIRVDIADFYIDHLEILKNSQQCIAVSKHLCGGATDLMLRCIVQASEVSTDFIMIALCCHHRCDWPSFVGKDFFKENHISPREFIIITKMASWAICGTGMSREKRKALQDQDLMTEKVTDNSSNQRLSLVERETIGFMCKRVLDYARLEYLRQNGYNAELNNYVPKEVTLENVVLLGRRKVKS